MCKWYICCFLSSLLQIRSDQSLSNVRLFATPWIAGHQASLSITNSQSSLRLTSIESVMPSIHLILCCPLLLLPSIFPSIRVFSNESAGDIENNSTILVQFSWSVVSNSLRPHESQDTRPPCPSPSPGVYPNTCPLSPWYHPTISSSVIPFSSCLQSFPASGSFQMISSLHQVAKVLEFQLQHEFFQWIFRTDFL